MQLAKQSHSGKYRHFLLLFIVPIIGLRYMGFLKIVQDDSQSGEIIGAMMMTVQDNSNNGISMKVLGNKSKDQGPHGVSCLKP